MKRTFFSIFFALQLLAASAQPVGKKLEEAFRVFEADSQLRHAVSSLYVIDAKTGEVVFEKNARLGLAPASTQKIITSVTAFELLGSDYRYKTIVGYKGKIRDNAIQEGLVIQGFGDPALGSFRFPGESRGGFMNNILEALQDAGVRTINGLETWNGFDQAAIPDGWIWQDIGNYYGAAHHFLNWNENQFDIRFSSPPALDGPTKVIAAPASLNIPINNQVRSARKGSGDNAYIYWPPFAKEILVKGTIPLGEDGFTISGAIPDPQAFFLDSLKRFLSRQQIRVEGQQAAVSLEGADRGKVSLNELYTHYSPSLDSLIYWFNKKSVNFYGEALLKTLAWEKQGFARTDSGLHILKKFWKGKGLDEDELNMYDGSGLSPLNRVTTHAQVEILKYAKTRSWYPYFYDALPEYNGMKMKSGTINDVKGFCGYHVAANGKEYIFSFLVNNYSGRASQLVSKMYRVLGELK